MYSRTILLIFHLYNTVLSCWKSVIENIMIHLNLTLFTPVSFFFKWSIFNHDESQFWISLWIISPSKLICEILDDTLDAYTSTSPEIPSWCRSALELFDELTPKKRWHRLRGPALGNESYLRRRRRNTWYITCCGGAGTPTSKCCVYWQRRIPRVAPVGG